MVELQQLDYDEIWRELYLDPRETYAVEDIAPRTLKTYGSPPSGALSLLTTRLGSWTVAGRARAVAESIEGARR